MLLLKPYITFTFKRVDSEELLKRIYQLRYEVYCQECHFLTASDYPDGLETDEYDPFSIHFAAINHDAQVVGTVRLILPNPLGFPLEKRCRLDIDPHKFPREKIAEISRLAVSKKYRRRADDELYGTESYLSVDPWRRRRYPIVVLGLYRTIYQESKKSGLALWYAAMEKKLWRALRLYGIHFTKIGKEVDYYGPVAPYLGVIKELERTVSLHKPELFRYFTKGLEHINLDSEAQELR